jgi:hypothetical protein
MFKILFRKVSVSYYISSFDDLIANVSPKVNRQMNIVSNGIKHAPEGRGSLIIVILFIEQHSSGTPIGEQIFYTVPYEELLKIGISIWYIGIVN